MALGLSFSDLENEFCRATLKADATLYALVGERIYWEQAPNGAAMPYVTMHHYKGGWENETQRQTADYMMKVVGHANSDPFNGGDTVARELASAIQIALTDATLIDATGSPVGYAPVEMKYPFADGYLKQNFTYWQVGGIFRFRFATCD